MLKIDIKKVLEGSSQKMNLEVCLEIKEHEFVAVSGESGAGKTSLLRVLAGLETAKGDISFSDNVWLENGKSLAPQKREIGFVFQDYALFDNMSVEQNLLYVNKDKALAQKLLSLTHLSELKNRSTTNLSGGQKQRVSLCRALMNKPRLLLMDEPFSALDPLMREQLQEDILVLHKEFGTTTLMVSHDPSEIYKLCNRVLVLKEGKLIEDGSVKEILLRTQGSQKFSLQGKVLDIISADIIFIAIVSIGQQIVEIVLDENEAKGFKVGESVSINTKAFSPTLMKLKK